MPDEKPATTVSHESLASLFQDIADEIRHKRSDLPTNPKDLNYRKLVADNFAEEIYGIVTLVEGTSGDDAAASDLLSGKKAHTANGAPIIGTMANNGPTGGTITTQGGQVTIPAGYTSGGTVTANLTAGDYTPSVASHSITTAPVVTPSVGGTVTAITVDTKPSGTDGTDYWTLNPGGSVTTTGKSSTTAKAIIGTAGYLAKDTTGKTTSPADVVDITPTVADGTNVYIKKGSASTPSGQEAVITPSLSIDKDTGVVTATGSATVSVTPTTTAGYIAANSGSAANVTGKIASTGNTLSLGVGTASTPSGEEAVITPSFSLDATTGKVTVTGSAIVSVTPTTTEGFIKANAGSAANVTGKIKTTENANVYDLGVGTATTPTDTITENPTIEWDSTNSKIKASYSGSKSITPTTTAGYIGASSGTAGTISTSGTTSVTVASLDSEFKAANIAKGATIFGVDGTYTSDADAAAGDILKNKTAYVNGSKITGTIESKAAATYYPLSTDQEIAASQYLSGKQTIKAVTTSGISAANIKSGATVKVGDTADDDRITSVDGTFSASSTVTGTGVTAASAGNILLNKAAFLNGAQITGEMPNQGAKTPTITTQGGTWPIPAGYHNGEGIVTANITASTLDDTIIGGSAYEEATDDYAWKTTVTIPAGYHTAQTIEKTFSSVFPAPDTEGTRDEVLLGYELFDHDGKKITGTMPNNTVGGTISTQGGYIDIPLGYTPGGRITADITPGSHSAVATKVSNASAQIDATGFTAASSNTTHYVTLTTGNGSAKATSKIDTGGYLAQDTTGVDSASNATIGVTIGNSGVTRINIPDGSHSAVATKVSDATAGISANGFTVASSNTTHYVTLTTSAGSAKATSKIDTAGYLNKDTTGVDSASNASIGVTVTGDVTRINIPDGAHSAVATKVSNATAGISANGFTGASSATTHYVELTTSAGSAKATSKIDTAGYLDKDTTGVDSSSNASVPVTVTGNVTKIYIPDGAHSATATKVSAGSASIAASSNVPTTNTNTGYYIELTTSSGYAKATSKIDTAGYLTKDTTGVDSASNVEVNVTGNGSKIYLDVETALPTNTSPGTRTGYTTWPLSY